MEDKNPNSLTACAHASLIYALHGKLVFFLNQQISSGILRNMRIIPSHPDSSIFNFQYGIIRKICNKREYIYNV